MAHPGRGAAALDRAGGEWQEGFLARGAPTGRRGGAGADCDGARRGQDVRVGCAGEVSEGEYCGSAVRETGRPFGSVGELRPRDVYSVASSREDGACW